MRQAKLVVKAVEECCLLIDSFETNYSIISHPNGCLFSAIVIAAFENYINVKGLMEILPY